MSSIRYILTVIRWPLGCLIFFIAACKQPKADVSSLQSNKDNLQQQASTSKAIRHILVHEKNIKTGDLVTRTGADFTSESLRNLCRRDKTYSHCGIASWENDSLYVYHAMGGEWNPDEKLRRDTWLQFAEPYTNRGFGHYSFSLTAKATDSLLKEVQRLYKNGMSFDMKFDLSTDEKMYCAEFIAKTFERAIPGFAPFNRSKIEQFEFIGVDDLFLHPLSKKIAATVYK